MDMLLQIIKTKCKENDIKVTIENTENVYNIDFENNNCLVKTTITETSPNNFNLGMYNKNKGTGKDKCRFYKEYNTKIMLDLYKSVIGWFIVDNEFYGGKEK